MEEHSAAQALNSSACRVTSTISGRGPVRIAKALWRSTSGHRDHSSTLFHICPLCSLKLYMAPATTHTNLAKKFSLIVWYCKKLSSRRSSVTQATVHSVGVSNCNDLPPWIGVTLNSGCRQSTMPSLCVINLKNPSGYGCSPRKDPIRMLLTRNSTTNTPNIMPVRETLGGCLSICLQETSLALGTAHKQTQTLLAQTTIAKSLPQIARTDWGPSEACV